MGEAAGAVAAHAAHDGVITCDADGRVQMMNPVARELTGWSQSEASGQPLEKVFHIVNETTRKTVETPVSKVKRLDRIVGVANHTVLVRKDGTELNIADSGAPIRDKKGEIRGSSWSFATSRWNARPRTR